MGWPASVIRSLASSPVVGYYPQQTPSAEPTALSGLALMASGRRDAAKVAVDWLRNHQQPDGSVPASSGADAADWPTGLAVMAWAAYLPYDARLQRNIDAAVRWICDQTSQKVPPSAVLGHDGQLLGWPWVEGTAPWIEPTALHVLALKTAGRSPHPRVREAVRLLLDRQLSAGGCNYGNTSVFGTELRPHPQPTGLSLLALAGESNARDPISRSVAYLQDVIFRGTTTISLCWSLMGLAACGAVPEQAASRLQDAAQRVRQRDGSAYKYALIALAARADRNPLVTLPRGRGLVPDPAAEVYDNRQPS